MTDFNALDIYDDTFMTSQELIDALNQDNAAARELPGAVAGTILTIASGSITPTGGSHSLETESALPTDILTHINYANVRDGAHLFLHGETPGSRVVTIQSMAGGIGQINLVRDNDLVCKTRVGILLERRGSIWHEIERFGGPDLDLGDGSGATFSGIKYNKGNGTLEVWIEGVKLGIMSATYESA